MTGQKIGMALGSGAVRGYALIPIINRLKKEGIKISAVSGSSAGALIGAYYALHGEIDSMLEMAKEMGKKDYAKLVDLNNPKKSLIKGKKIKKFFMDRFFSDNTFKECKIPLFICAVELTQRKPEFIKRGRIIDSVMASISIPGIFPPYRIKDKLYIDGGVLEPVPVKPLLNMGLKKILAVNLMGSSLTEEKQHQNLFPAVMDTFYLMMEQLARTEDDKRIFTLKLNFKPDPVNMLSFYDWKEQYQVGEKIIKERMAAIKKWLD
jgi:NTE family protein